MDVVVVVVSVCGGNAAQWTVCVSGFLFVVAANKYNFAPSGKVFLLGLELRMYHFFVNVQTLERYYFNFVKF